MVQLIAVLRRQYWRYGRAWRRIFNELGHRLPLVRRKGRDVDELRDLWIITRFCDHYSAVRMSDQHHWPFCLRNHQSCCRNVVSQSQRWVLNDADVIAILPQEFVNALPAGAVNKATVNQNNCGRRRGLNF